MLGLGRGGVIAAVSSLSLEAEGIRGIALTLGDQALKDKITAVMHIGQFLTNVVILKGGFLTASRVIPTADENFSRVLVGETIVDGKTVNVTREQADIVKKDIGIPMGDSETSAGRKLCTAGRGGEGQVQGARARQLQDYR